MRIRDASAAVTLVAGLALVATAPPASAAANPGASCVGTIASTLAPLGELDVREFKALGRALGERTFGGFVSTGARQHSGDLEACVPEAQP